MSIPEQKHFGREPLREGRWEETPLTDGDREAHARAEAAINELYENPWIGWDYDTCHLYSLHPRKVFAYTESEEDWHARRDAWRAAVNEQYRRNLEAGMGEAGL